MCPRYRWIAAFACFLASCAGGPPPNPETGAAVPPPGSEAPAGEGFHYVLQRGDRIEIRVHNLPELDEEVIVRPDGRISAVMLDDVAAAGLSPEELAAKLVEGWSGDFQDPQATVVVREFASHNVYVGGEVGMPGIVPLPARLSSLRAIFEAGGFRNTSQLTNVLVLRDAGGAPTVFSLDAEKILLGEVGDLLLEPYDVIFVPRSKIARVNLFVEQWITQMIPVQLQGAVGYNYLAGGQ